MNEATTPLGLQFLARTLGYVMSSHLGYDHHAALGSRSKHYSYTCLLVTEEME